MPEHLSSNAQIRLSKVPHIGPCNDLATIQGWTCLCHAGSLPVTLDGEKAVQDKKKTW